jgi:dihydrofolate reductase
MPVHPIAPEESQVRKLVVTEFVSLDGVTDDPAWTAPYWSDDIGEFKFAELFGSDSLLLGRVTYEGFAEAWPDRTDEQGYADRINSMPKHVVSTTLSAPTWNNSEVIDSDVAGRIAQLKQEDGQDILVFGSGTLAQTLIQEGLVDRYNLLVYPVVLGSGRRMFRDETTAKLRLTDTRSFPAGVVLLVYEPDDAAPPS